MAFFVLLYFINGKNKNFSYIRITRTVQSNEKKTLNKKNYSYEFLNYPYNKFDSDWIFLITRFGLGLKIIFKHYYILHKVPFILFWYLYSFSFYLPFDILS